MRRHAEVCGGHQHLEVEANHCGLPVGGLREQFESCSEQPCVGCLAHVIHNVTIAFGTFWQAFLL